MDVVIGAIITIATSVAASIIYDWIKGYSILNTFKGWFIKKKDNNIYKVSGNTYIIEI